MAKSERRKEAKSHKSKSHKSGSKHEKKHRHKEEKKHGKKPKHEKQVEEVDASLRIDQDDFFRLNEEFRVWLKMSENK
jgi:hypothetical protein